jgi:hypothetical protein
MVLGMELLLEAKCFFLLVQMMAMLMEAELAYLLYKKEHMLVQLKGS